MDEETGSVVVLLITLLFIINVFLTGILVNHATRLHDTAVTCTSPEACYNYVVNTYEKAGEDE